MTCTETEQHHHISNSLTCQRATCGMTCTETLYVAPLAFIVKSKSYLWNDMHWDHAFLADPYIFLSQRATCGMTCTETCLYQQKFLRLSQRATCGMTCTETVLMLEMLIVCCQRATCGMTCTETLPCLSWGYFSRSKSYLWNDMHWDFNIGKVITITWSKSYLWNDMHWDTFICQYNFNILSKSYLWNDMHWDNSLRA